MKKYEINLYATSIDVLPSKNQALCEILYTCKNIADTLINIIYVFIKLREKGLITKEHIVTHKHLNFV